MGKKMDAECRYGPTGPGTMGSGGMESIMDMDDCATTVVTSTLASGTTTCNTATER